MTMDADGQTDDSDPELPTNRRERKKAKRKLKKKQKREALLMAKRARHGLPMHEAESVEAIDQRFAGSLSSNVNFGIDRTHSKYKSTPAMEQFLLKQSNKRRQQPESTTISKENV